MKRIYVEESWCLGCHLCEYHCAFANSGKDDMVKALKGVKINPRIQIESEQDAIHFAVSCRHCNDPICLKSCISGALYAVDGQIRIDQEKCVGCYTCVLVCPYGAIMPADGHAAQKCELCAQNAGGEPACVRECPNRAIIFEEREAAAV